MMRIIIIGNCGSGKSTLALKIAQVTQYPLMQLDSIWHKTDYSKEAKINFKTEQKNFCSKQIVLLREITIVVFHLGLNKQI